MTFDEHQVHKEMLSGAEMQSLRLEERAELHRKAESDAEIRQLLSLESVARGGAEDEPVCIPCNSILNKIS